MSPLTIALLGAYSNPCKKVQNYLEAQHGINWKSNFK